MAEGESKTSKVWIFVSIVLLVAVLVLGFMLYKEKFMTGKVIDTNDDSNVATQVLVSNAQLDALVSDEISQDQDETVDLSQEDLSLKV